MHTAQRTQPAKVMGTAEEGSRQAARQAEICVCCTRSSASCAIASAKQFMVYTVTVCSALQH